MWKKSEEPADLTKVCFRALKDNKIGRRKKLGKIMPRIAFT